MRATDGIPPPSRNHRTPTASDTPASPAASTVDTPRAIAAQNRWRSSRRPTDGRPGEYITGRPARSDLRRCATIATPLVKVMLRGPVEPRQYTSFDYTQVLSDHEVLASIGTIGDALDNALAES